MWNPSRVVAVGTGSNLTGLLGSGVVVSEDRVVTARHVVARAEGAPTTLWIACGGKTWPCCSMWLDETLDVAVLTIGEPTGMRGDPLRLLSSRDTRPGQKVSLQGFPKVSSTLPSTGLWHPNGETQQWTSGMPDLRVEVNAPPEEVGGWGGLSGGPVVDCVRGEVLGIVRAVPDNWDGKVIAAIPAPRLLANPAFLAALGLEATHQELDTHVEALEASVVEYLLHDRALIGRAVAAQVGIEVNGDEREWAGAIARKIVRGMTASKFAETLLHADDALGTGRDAETAHRHIADLLDQTLPLVADIRAIVAFARFEQSRGRRFFDLPLCRVSLAEVVANGIERKRWSFRPLEADQKPPTVVVSLTVPVAARIPTIDTDAKPLVEAVVECLSAPERLNLGEVERVRRAGTKPDWSAVVADAETKMERLGGLPGPRMRQHYLFIQERLSGEIFAVVSETFAKALPSLKVVRLTGEFGPAETDLATLIDELKKPRR